MEETVTRVKLARAIRATQRRLRVRLRVAFRRARVGRERATAARWRGRRRAKTTRSAVRRSSEPPPRKAPVVSILPRPPQAKRATAQTRPRMATARDFFAGLARRIAWPIAPERRDEGDVR